MLKFDHEDAFNLSPFARWNSSLSLNAFLGGDSVWHPTPCWDWRPSGHPVLLDTHPRLLSSLLQLDMPEGHHPIQQSRMGLQRLGGTKPLLHTEPAPTNLPQLAGIKERSWTLRAPNKMFILINLNNFKTCLYEAIFVSTQSHVYKQLSSDYHSNEDIFRISSPKYFF